MTSVIPDPSMSLLMYSSGLSSNNSSSASVSANTVSKEYTTQESLLLLYHYASVHLHVWYKKSFARYIVFFKIRINIFFRCMDILYTI